jgi:formate dehydrogenase subunit gamma
MLHSQAKRLGALILGAVLYLPLGAAAQQPAAPAKAPGATPPPAAAPAAAPAPAPVQAMPAPAPGSTAVPGWNQPPKGWESVDRKPQYASVPGRETNVLIQGAGHEWRKFRNGPLTKYGGWLIVLAIAVLMLFYVVKGQIKLHGAPTGRMIERFNSVERVAHWTMALSFVVLALSGIVILFGKYIILPWLGHAGFSSVTIVSKNLHNFVGPLFVFSLVVVFLIYVKDNLPAAGDLTWLTRLGGMFSKSGGGDVPSGRFNGGEKLWFWGGVVLLGATVSVTGLILDFPNWNQSREAMQQANVIHGIAAVLFVSASFLHIYLGTIGMQGAYRSMRDGLVDETWAKEHHSLWYDEVKQGKRPEKIAGGSAQPATGD